MYQDFYKMDVGPFPTQPMPGVFFESKTHAEALSFIQHGIKERESFLLVTGKYGLGKTLLCLRLMKSFRRIRHLFYSLYIPTPTCKYDIILRNICETVGIDAVPENAGIEQFQFYLFDFYRKKGSEAKKFFIIIDDFQEIDSATLNYLKSLANFTTDEGFFPFSLILFAHPLIHEKLKLPIFGSFEQKIKRHFQLSPFNLGETREYIYFRLLYSGARGKPFFTEGAIKLIYRFSGGNPRLINNICDASLLIGSRKKQGKIEEDVVAEAVQSLTQAQRKKSSPPLKRKGEIPQKTAVTGKKRAKPEVSLSKVGFSEEADLGKGPEGFQIPPDSEDGLDFTNIQSNSPRLAERKLSIGARSQGPQGFWEGFWGRKGPKIIVWLLVLFLLFLLVYRYHDLLFGKFSKQSIRYKIDMNYFGRSSPTSLNGVPIKVKTAKQNFFDEVKEPVITRPFKTDGSSSQRDGHEMLHFYTLILSSHLSRENAMEDVTELTRKGLSQIFLRKIFSKGKVWWVTFQGAYESRKLAEEAKVIYHFPNAVIREASSAYRIKFLSPDENSEKGFMQLKKIRHVAGNGEKLFPAAYPSTSCACSRFLKNFRTQTDVENGTV